jgi:hypothetical protein
MAGRRAVSLVLASIPNFILANTQMLRLPG